MLTYPKDVPYRRTADRSIDRGDSSNVSVIEMSAHAGTHVDAPRHYLPDGLAIDGIPLDRLFGPAFVADCRGVPAVTAALLKAKVPPATERLLLKTDNSQLLGDRPDGPYDENHVYLDGSGARFAVDNGIRLVGIDYLSIDKFGAAEKPAHHTLLGKDVIIVEAIDLSDVQEGEYFLACGPLKMTDSDGGPCRAVLIENLL